MAVRCMRVIYCPVLLLLILLSSGCSTTKQTEKVAEAFLQAAVQNDIATLQEVVDPALQEDLYMSVMLQYSIMALVDGSRAEYAELNIETIRNDGTNAVVRYEGKLKLIFMGSPITFPDKGEVYLKKIDGDWYVTDHYCDPQMPF